MGMNRKRTLHLVVVASLVLVATVAGIAFAFHRPHATISQVASLANVPAASPSVDVEAAVPAASLPAFACGTSTLKAQSSPATAFINAVRTGSHTGYDRLVIQFGNGQPSSVTLRPQPTTSFVNSPRGDTVVLAGRVGLAIVIMGADAHTSYAGPYVLKPNGPALIELRRLEDFEGYVQWGLGLARSACYRSFVLANPTRIVVDVQVG
jgi:hypothetical protein